MSESAASSIWYGVKIVAVFALAIYVPSILRAIERIAEALERCPS